LKEGERKQIEIKNELSQVSHKEEIMWKESSRINWLKEGEFNTSFFQKSANGKKSISWIQCMEIPGTM